MVVVVVVVVAVVVAGTSKVVEGLCVRGDDDDERWLRAWGGRIVRACTDAVRAAPDITWCGVVLCMVACMLLVLLWGLLDGDCDCAGPCNT